MGVVPNPELVAAAPAVRPRYARIFKFGIFELRPDTGELWKHGVRIKLQTKPLQVLEALLAEPGEVVTRECLFKRLWPEGTFVDFESGLNTATNRLRAALGDSAGAPRYIETLPRVGYRFICPVSERPAAGRTDGLSSVVPAEPSQATPDNGSIATGPRQFAIAAVSAGAAAIKKLSKKYRAAAAVLLIAAVILLLVYAHSRWNILRLQPTVKIGLQESGKTLVEAPSLASELAAIR